MVPKLNRGGQGLLPTSPDGFGPELGSVTDSVGCDHEEKDLRRSKEKAAPLDVQVWGGGGYGESPEFLAKGQFQRGAEGGYNLCFGQGWW